MKAYTDLEQSKKLAEILPLESADMWYQYIGESFKDGITKPIYFPMVIRDDPSEKDIPCWSLDALLKVIPYVTLSNYNGVWSCDSYNKEKHTHVFGKLAYNPIDACMEMINKLKIGV